MMEERRRGEREKGRGGERKVQGREEVRDGGSEGGKEVSAQILNFKGRPGLKIKGLNPLLISQVKTVRFTEVKVESDRMRMGSRSVAGHWSVPGTGDMSFQVTAG